MPPVPTIPTRTSPLALQLVNFIARTGLAYSPIADRRAAVGKWIIRERFNRRGIRAGIRNANRGGSPMDSISDHSLHIPVVVSRIRLMPGPKIKNTPVPTSPASTTAENLPTRKPRDENKLVRLGNPKWLAIHLLRRQLEILSDSLRDGMMRCDVPKTFLVIGFTPFE